MSELALEAGIEPDELRAYLEREVERRRAAIVSYPRGSVPAESPAERVT